MNFNYLIQCIKLHEIRTMASTILFQTVTREWSVQLFSFSLINKGCHGRGSVWIISLIIGIGFYNLFPIHLSKFKFWLTRYIKYGRPYLTTIPNTLKFVRNTPLWVLFSNTFLAVRNVIKCVCLITLVLEAIYGGSEREEKLPLVESVGNLTSMLSPSTEIEPRRWLGYILVTRM